MLGGLILMFDDVSGIIGTYEGIPIEIFDLPKENQILIVKVDIDKYGIDTAFDIFNGIRETIPEHIIMLGIPSGIELECWDAEDINNHIKYFEDAREKLR